MKKLFYSLFALAMTAMTLTSCEDVPAPYDYPTDDGGGEVVTGEYLNETFNSSFGKFEVKTIKGTPWAIDYNTAKATGYDNTSKVTTESESYLISPAVDLTNSTAAYLQFEYIYQYKREGAYNKVLITDNYTGDPSTTTWEDITGTLTVGSDWTTFTTYAYNLDSKYLGKKNIRIALYYSCGSQSSTIEIKNLVMKDGKVDVPETPETSDVISPVNGTYINESFSSDFGVFSVSTVKGTAWAISYSQAKASGYDSGTKTTTPSESYLISKPMDMSASTGATVSFSYILRYVTDNGAAVDGIENKVLITDNYTGDPSTTIWTDITGTLTEGTDWKTYSTCSASVPSACLGKGKVVVALKYACNASSGTWEVKDLTVKDGSSTPITPSESGTNGDFETWSDNAPSNWKSTSTASSATLSQSTDAHGGKYSVLVEGTTSGNKRIAYQEMELKAGTYTMKFYAKAATADGASVRPGFVPITDGKAGSYVYGNYVNDISNTTWQLVEYSVEIPSDGTYCVLIMNPKSPGKNVLIDDFTLDLGTTSVIK